jgi:hypothetical protein
MDGYDMVYGIFLKYGNQQKKLVGEILKPSWFPGGDCVTVGQVLNFSWLSLRRLLANPPVFWLNAIQRQIFWVNFQFFHVSICFNHNNPQFPMLRPNTSSCRACWPDFFV